MKRRYISEYNYLHTKERMEERYNYKDLTKTDYLKMCKLCIENSIKIKDEFTSKGYQYIYRIIFKGIKIIVVYTSWTKQINTVLPYNHFDKLVSLILSKNV